MGNGRLISIDTYDGPFAARLPVAEALIERSGSGGRHEHIRDQSWFGLAELARRGEEPGMVYVDGCHELECVAVDAFLSDQILAVGGILAFNDAGWPSVHSVLQRLVRMDRYDELATGAPRNYRGRNAAYSLVRRLQRRSNEDRHFRKLSHRLPPGPVR